MGKLRPYAAGVADADIVPQRSSALPPGIIGETIDDHGRLSWVTKVSPSSRAVIIPKRDQESVLT